MANRIRLHPGPGKRGAPRHNRAQPFFRVPAAAMRFVTRVAIVLAAVIAVSVLSALAWDRSDVRAQEPPALPSVQR